MLCVDICIIIVNVTKETFKVLKDTDIVFEKEVGKNKVIRILQFGLTENIGGIETYLNRLTTSIDKAKYQMDFLVLGKEKPCFYEELTQLNSNFYFVTDRKENPIKNRNEIKRLLTEEKFDIIQCNLNSLSYITLALEADKLGIPTIIHSRNASNPPSFKSKLFHNINFHRIKSLDVTRLAVSQKAGVWMFGEDSDFSIVNNGIEMENYKFNMVDRQSIRTELGIDETTDVIIHTGAFRKQKNHYFIVNVFNEYLKLNPNSKLLLVGTGNLLDDIKNFVSELGISDSVYFLGNREDIGRLLAAADKFLFPSFYEGFPNSVLEALCSGLPSVISQTITNEVVLREECVQLPLELTYSDWAKVLLKVKSFERSEAYKIIEHKGFSVESEVNRMQKIYSHILRGSEESQFDSI